MGLHLEFDLGIRKWILHLMPFPEKNHVSEKVQPHSSLCTSFMVIFIKAGEEA